MRRNINKPYFREYPFDINEPVEGIKVGYFIYDFKNQTERYIDLTIKIDYDKPLIKKLLS